MKLKLTLKTLLLFAFLSTTSAVAQTPTPNTPFQHVIIVIQENRTPDNLFGSDAFATPKQLPGADLVQDGQCYNIAPYSVPLTSIRLGDQCDPGHLHEKAWVPTYNDGAMDGACMISGNAGCGNRQYPEYTYVNGSDVGPYFQIAQQYGYANYMFQTNQGPSFPAHQFLFSGTSAPIYPNDPGDTTDYWKWFAAELADHGDPPIYGCSTGAAGTKVKQIGPGNVEGYGYDDGLPCYNHNTLATLLDTPPYPLTKINWKYYSHASVTVPENPATSLWTAPNAITGICEPLDGNGNCNGTDWTLNVASVLPYASGYLNSFSPILTDLGADPSQQQCTLPPVSWVIPDGTWSDHGGQEIGGAGPSWVVAIVNAVGGYDNSGNKLATNCGYWSNTAILIVWDDWGGWYDHVLPWRCPPGPHGSCLGYDNGGQPQAGEYVYGFRVPFLVVSAYTGTFSNNTWSGYISGACGTGNFPNCPNNVQPYVHDFGSILNFIEYALGVNSNSIGTIDPTYQYADEYAPDGHFEYAPSTYSLSDFFPTFSPQNARQFTPFTQGVTYATECFIVPATPTCFGPDFAASDPDADAVDED